MSSTAILGLEGAAAPGVVPTLDAKLGYVRELLRRELALAPGEHDACLTCSFQAEDVLLLYLARELRPGIPVLFLDTGSTSRRRMRTATGWRPSGG